MTSDGTSHYEDLIQQIDVKGDKFCKAITFEKSEYGKLQLPTSISEAN